MTVAMFIAWAIGLALLAALAWAAYFALTTRRIAAEAERLVPASGTFVTVRGNRIHYEEQGEGPPILFLHGLGGQLHHFRHPLFKAFGPGYRLIALDRPGSGYSVRKGGKGGLTEQAEVIAAFIDRLGLQRPLLVGHSLGGAVALAVALNHTDKISGIALISPLTHREEVLRPQFTSLAIRSPLRRWLVAHTVAVPASLKYARQTLDFVFGPQPPPEEYRVEGGGLAGLRPAHIYATASDLVALEHELAAYEARYHEIRLPAGLLFGSADRVLDYREHGLPMAERIAGLDVEILEGIGHMPQFVAADRVVAFIRRIARRAFAGVVDRPAGGTEGPIAAFDGKSDGDPIMYTATPNVIRPGGLVIQPFNGTVKVTFSDAVIASSDRAKVLLEPGYEPVYYIPFEDIYFELLEKTGTTTHSPAKGTASYWRATAVGAAANDVMWSYETPTEGAMEIVGHGAFDGKQARIEATPVEDWQHTPHVVE